MIQTLILTLRVEDHGNGRKDLESIENNVYQVKNEFEIQQLVNKELGFNSDNGVSVYSLSDFMDAFNDEYIADDALWVGYVQIEY
jgi:hypothetical protein